MRGALAAAALALAGCDMQPMPFPGSPGELGDRPGIFTGQTGEVTLCCHTAPAQPPAPAPAKQGE